MKLTKKKIYSHDIRKSHLPIKKRLNYLKNPTVFLDLHQDSKFTKAILKIRLATFKNSPHHKFITRQNSRISDSKIAGTSSLPIIPAMNQQQQESTKVSFDTQNFGSTEMIARVSPVYHTTSEKLFKDTFRKKMISRK